MSATAGPAGSGFAMPRPARARGDANGTAGPGDPAGTGNEGPEPLAPGETVELGEEQQAQRLSAMLDEFDREFVGLAPVKARVREIAALLLIDRLRQRYGLTSSRPSLHMCFTGSPGTGKTTVAMHMGEMLRELGYLRKGQLVSVTRDDLVGQYVGHTAPKTKEVLKRAMGGVLLIDEAYYLYRPENERDYGQEAIEILLQFMEAHREDLVVILAGVRRPDGRVLPVQPRDGLPDRAPHRLPGLLPGRADADRRADAGPGAVPAVRGGPGGVRRVRGAADDAAPVRQRAQHPQRHRPDAAAPGPAAGGGGRHHRP